MICKYATLALPDDPTVEYLHHPYLAYNQGWDARDLGLGKYVNPYAIHSRNWQWWRDGWLQEADI